MKNHYLQNALITVAIIAVVGSFYYSLFSGGSQQEQKLASLTAEPSSETGARKQFLPGDERMGTPNREIEYDADGTKCGLQAKFKNGAQVKVSFDSYGRQKEARETLPNGDYQISHFKSGSILQKLQAFRANNTLQKDVVFAKDEVNTIMYADDGVTVARKETVNEEEGTFEGTIYTPLVCGNVCETKYSGKDGQVKSVTIFNEAGGVKAKAKHTSGLTFAVTCYGNNGVRSSGGKIVLYPVSDDPDADPAMDEVGYMMSGNEITCYAADGKTVSVTALYGVMSEEAAEDYRNSFIVHEHHEDGSILHTIKETDSEDPNRPKNSYRLLESFGLKGELKGRSYIRYDSCVLRQETVEDGIVTVVENETEPFPKDETAARLDSLITEVHSKGFWPLETALQTTPLVHDLSLLFLSMAE